MIQLIVLGQQKDPHIREVVDATGSAFKKRIIINHFELPKLSIVISEGAEHFVLDGKNIDLCAPTVIWYRVKPNFGYELPEAVLGSPGADFFREHWRSFILPIPELFKNAVVINPILESERISNKIRQARLASRLGFEIPACVFGNDANTITGTLGEQIAFKGISSRCYPGASKMTQVLDCEFLLENGESVRVVPSIFQNYIEKSYELRVLSFRESSLAIKIDSQRQEDTKTDWRRNQVADMFSDYNLPPDVSHRCQEFIRAAGLHSGVFDIIRDQSGEYIFVECNPEGQWLGYAERVGVDWVTPFSRMLTDAARNLV